MNAVGIDVSKGKSMVAIVQPFGVVIAEPFEVSHNAEELQSLYELLQLLGGETKVVMEYTGTYYEPIANALHNAGIFVFVVNALVIDEYSTNRVRKVKTNKKDAFKIANYALNNWTELREYAPAEDIRQTLKILNRQYIQFNKILVMQKNNLIALLDSCFPNANTLFSSPCRESDGHEKWVDFVLKFPHRETVSTLCPSVFKAKYKSWRNENQYRYSESKAAEIHACARAQTSSLPFSESAAKLIAEPAKLLNSTLETLATIRYEMDNLASQLPEYEAVINLYDVGRVFGAQLIAEIGDVRRLKSAKSAVALAGIDPPPNQSGANDPKSRSISKRGSPALRKTLFQIMAVYIQQRPSDEPVYQFLDKKRAEGKPYRVYMIAAAHKFLRIYYARVMDAIA